MRHTFRFCWSSYCFATPPQLWFLIFLRPKKIDPNPATAPTQALRVDLSKPQPGNILSKPKFRMYTKIIAAWIRNIRGQNGFWRPFLHEWAWKREGSEKMNFLWITFVLYWRTDTRQTSDLIRELIRNKRHLRWTQQCGWLRYRAPYGGNFIGKRNT